MGVANPPGTGIAPHIHTIGKIVKAYKDRLKLEAELRKRLLQASTELGKQPTSPARS